MEMNPFTLDAEGKPFPLDMRGELDDTAYFKSGKKWGDVEFPLPFGRSMSAAEVPPPFPLGSKVVMCCEFISSVPLSMQHACEDRGTVS
jgi:hypothetical protein